MSSSEICSSLRSCFGYTLFEEHGDALQVDYTVDLAESKIKYKQQTSQNILYSQ